MTLYFLARSLWKSQFYVHKTPIITTQMITLNIKRTNCISCSISSLQAAPLSVSPDCRTTQPYMTWHHFVRIRASSNDGKYHSESPARPYIWGFICSVTRPETISSIYVCVLLTPTRRGCRSYRLLCPMANVGQTTCCAGCWINSFLDAESRVIKIVITSKLNHCRLRVLDIPNLFFYIIR